jgi:hypothetical protein
LSVKGKHKPQIKVTPPEGRVKAAKQQFVAVETFMNLLLGLEVALAQSDVARAGSGNLAAYAQWNLLDFAAVGQKTGGLLFNGHAGEVSGRGYYGFALGGFCGSHGDPWSQSI